jgi:hypothetical protein
MLVSLFCCGCIVLPIRAPTRTEGASAKSRAKADLGFLEVGKTTRGEIAEKLSWMDTGVKDDRLFVGRWMISNWGVFWAVTGQYRADAGWNRNWKRNNLIVEFDEQGVTQAFKVLPDKELTNGLLASLRRVPAGPLELSPPLELRYHIGNARDARYAKLILGQDSLEYREETGKHKHDFKISPDQIKSLSLDWVPSGQDHPDPTHMRQTIHFASKTATGRKLTLRTDIPTAVIVFKYFAQTRSNTASQEPSKTNP